MDRLIVKFKQLVLVAGDLLVWYAALATSLAIRALFPRHYSALAWPEHALPFSLLFLLWLVSHYVQGLYDLKNARNDAAFFRRAGIAYGVNTLLALAFFYLLPFFGIAPRTTLLISLAVTALLWTLWRLTIHALLARRVLRTRVAFIGWNEEARELDRLLGANPNIGYDIAARIESGFDELPSLLVRNKVNLVVLALSPRTNPELARPLYESIFLKVGFMDLIPFYEQITTRVPVSAITRVWFLENLREADKRAYDTIKRAADVLLSLLIGCITLLIGPALALAIRLDSRGAALFRQERVGKDGRPFTIFKFRTMREDAETTGAQWAAKDDDRITRVGHVLRLTRLDELPQIWNVLRGEMSFIGPRPERPEFVRDLTAAMPYYAMRHLVRPGLTGWAQVSMGYAGTIAENLKKLQFDLFYIKNRSPFLDFVILLRTIGTVLTAKGQ